MNLLRRIFIKDYKNVHDPVVREKHGLLASLSGIFINLISFVIKLVIGIFTFSMSIISDAINNLTDMFSCVVTLVGFKMSAVPADKRHPYGHERIEYISGMIIAFVITAVGIVLGYESIAKLVIRESNLVNYGYIPILILAISIALKLLLGFIYRSLGKAIDSESIKASMIDSFNDAICTTGVLIATLINVYYKEIWWLDASVSLVISLFILYSGIKAVIETANPLIGVAADKELVAKIKNDILSYPVCIGLHDVTCHSYGHTKIFMTAHCEVDGYGEIMKIHDEIDNIEQDILKKYGVLLTIHMDPVDTKNKDLPILKEQITNIVKEIDDRLSIHDLRMVVGPSHTNVLFDVLKDPDIKIKNDELITQIKAKVEALNSNYNVIIKVDLKY